MSTKFYGVIAGVLLSGWASQACAGNTDVVLKAGTRGIGPELSYTLSPWLDARLSAAGYDYSRTGSSGSVNYDGRLKLQTIGILADLHPFRGAFRLSGGLLYNGNRLDLTATPNANSTYTINGTTYTASQVGSLTGSATFNKLAPYAGIGASGHFLGGHLVLSSDLGVMYQGAARVSLQATGAAADPALASDVAAQQQTLQSDADRYRFYPVIAVGAGFSF